MTPQALSEIHTAAFALDRAWSAAEFETLLQSAHTYLTTHQHGFALWRSIAGEAELLTIAVLPAQQNKGVGRHLMADWMTHSATSADTALLEVAADNKPARALYSAFGFAIVAKRLKYYARADGHSDALLMRAPLPLSRP